MNPENPVVQLCAEGSRYEFEGRLEEARACFRRAWEAARTDFDHCIAAHYVARYQKNSEEELRWNQLALEFAEKAGGEEVESFLPSLFLNLGHSHERLGDQANAKVYYDLAAGLGAIHQPGPNNRWEDGERFSIG